MNTRIEGVCPVVETPFTNDGRIDVESLRHLVRSLADAGVRSVMYPGFASEFYKLTDLERDELTGALLDEAHRHGIVVVVSVPDHATVVAVERARRAVEQGADMINILPPHTQSPSRTAVRAHIGAILDTTGSTPAILQYAPAQTGTALDAAVIAELAATHPNLVQVKVESVPPGQLISALREAAPGLSCLVGYAGVQLIDALRRGAVGVQPGSSFPEIYLAICDAWENGDRQRAAALHARLLPYISYWMQSVELIIAAEKEISAQRGLLRSATCRAPSRELDSEEQEMITRFLVDFDEFLRPAPRAISIQG